MQVPSAKKFPYFKYSLGIIFAGMLLRSLGVTRPLLGNFAIYQTAQAMIAQIFVENNFSTWLYPQVNVISQGKPGLILLYYPLSSLIAALAHAATNIPIDILGRVQATVFYSLAAFYLFKLVARTIGEKEACISTIVFSILPLTVIYGQSFQNEMATVFFSIFFIYQLHQSLLRFSLLHSIGVILALSGVMLTRPNNLFLLLPALYLLLSVPSDKRVAKLARTSVLILLGLIIPVFWYWHLWEVSQNHSNIYSTLYAQVMVRSSFISNMILQKKYYLQILFELIGIVLTPAGFYLLLTRLFFRSKIKGEYLFWFWILGFTLSSAAIPRKLIDHNFYWLHFITPASVLIALDLARINPKKIRYAVWLLFILFSIRYFYRPAFVTTEADKSIPEIAENLKSLTSKEKDRILVQGTHTLLYYADRYGWPFNMEKKDRNISDYYKYTNWEKLTDEQIKIRNQAYETPETTLEYLRQYENATHLAVSDYQAFLKNPIFAYITSRYAPIYQKDGVGAIFDLRSKLTSSD